ncbi:fluoride efflux transporter CrcB [Nibricoccus aquaticus]|uniref:Fluoride-specific ion channel FluC n=1 Tax=Nibricoccus aquaticus TaxID=2576891 RepID=A0A290QP27_9BACT|nr:fluoride efflux transporter CrcB [Nibricoccus aquaticus]
MTLYMWIALGGALGSVARFGAAEAVTRGVAGAFPWGTLVVNVVGSFVIGFFATLTAPGGRWPVGSEGRHFFMTGVLGGFTTFSSFSLQTLGLMQKGEWLRAGGNVAGSVGLCLVAVWLGHVVATAMGTARGA